MDEVICGLTSSWMPTFSRCTVRNALSRLLDARLSAWPVVIGISCPTSRCACWLSSVTMCGVWSRLDAVSLFTALMIPPRITLPNLPATPANPPVEPMIEVSACCASASLIVESVPVTTLDPLIVVVVVFS